MIKFSKIPTEEYKLEKCTEKDLDFLFILLKSTMFDYYIEAFGYWDDKEEMQYLLESFTNSKYYKILVDEVEIGCLAIKETSDSIFVEEIQIIPSMQNKGIGSLIINDIIQKAKNQKIKLGLEVLKQNKKALKFYQGIGFVIFNENETHYCLSI